MERKTEERERARERDGRELKFIYIYIHYIWVIRLANKLDDILLIHFMTRTETSGSTFILSI